MLNSLDSLELTKWLVWFEAKHERDEDAKEQARRDAELKQWANNA